MPKWWLVAAAVGVVACIVVGAEAWRFSEAMGCQPAIRHTLSSPDSRKIAVIFEMECGVATGFNTQVSIVPAGAKFSPDDHQAILVLKDRQSLDVKWRDEKTLMILVSEKNQIVRQSDASGETMIIYN